METKKSDLRQLWKVRYSLNYKTLEKKSDMNLILFSEGERPKSERTVSAESSLYTEYFTDEKTAYQSMKAWQVDGYRKG
jgi:hypothetical protein